MNLVKSKDYSVNYLSQIVEIKEFTEHPNPEVTRLKLAHIQGYNIIVGIDEQPGKFVYFPTNSVINPQFLSYANLYRDNTLNGNPEKTGMFEPNGRVKAIKLKGTVSEGFLLPLNILQDFIMSSVNKELTDEDCPNGLEFDDVQEGGKSFWLSRKYIIPEPTRQAPQNGERGNSHRKHKGIKKFSRIIENQFNFHYDTILLRKMPTVLGPNDLISITSKWHGTSGISAYIKCKHSLSLREKFAGWIAGRRDLFDDYDYVYSSRSVIKNQFENKEKSTGFYNSNVWNIADKYLRPYLVKGMTLYYEICGYLPTGGYIQKNYDYGCVIPESSEEYEQGVNYKIMIYRITMTNVDGIIHEFSAREVQQWCINHGLTPVNEFYYGFAKDLYPNLPKDAEDWSNKFMEMMANDDRFFMEKKSPDCNNKVPHEGIVIKKEDGVSRAWKLKCFAFINGEQAELDKGEVNIEDLA